MRVNPTNIYLRLEFVHAWVYCTAYCQSENQKDVTLWPIKNQKGTNAIYHRAENQKGAIAKDFVQL